MDHIPVNASPRYVKEEEILLSTFPAEVWNMILSKCEPVSLFLLNNSSQCFRNWLLQKRTAYLFPLVWILLKDYCRNLKVSRLTLTPCILDASQEQPTPTHHPLRTPSSPQVPPSSVKVISPQRYINNQRNMYFLSGGLRSTLKFRLVCKDWCQTINGMLLKELDQDKMDINRILEYQPLGGIVPWMDTKLKANFNFQKFQQVIFNESPFRKSRLIARAIVIEHWIPKTYNMLEQIGHEVWYCTMPISSGFNDKDRVYLNIKNALKLLPNLKYLEIEDAQDLQMHNDFDIDPDFEEIDALLEQQLLTMVSQNPIEKLKNLQVLQTKYVSSAIFNELLRSNSHVKTLVVERNINCGIYNIYTEHLTDVEELSFAIFNNSDIEQLSQPNVDWKLTKLYLKVDTGCDFNWNRLFELFNQKWKHTEITLAYLGQEWEGLGQDFLYTYSLGNRQHDSLGRPF